MRGEVGRLPAREPRPRPTAARGAHARSPAATTPRRPRWPWPGSSAIRTSSPSRAPARSRSSQRNAEAADLELTAEDEHRLVDAAEAYRPLQRHGGCAFARQDTGREIRARGGSGTAAGARTRGVVDDELTWKDATAQAELVRRGEASAARARRRGHRTDRPMRPGAERRHPPPVRHCPRPGGRGAARRAVSGRADPAQGPRRHAGGGALLRRDRLCEGCRLSGESRTASSCSGSRRRASSCSAGRTPPSSGPRSPPSRSRSGRRATPGTPSTRAEGRRAARRQPSRPAWCPVAHGNDGGGSIRIPASCCSLFGLKPSRGRVSNGPAGGESWNGFSVDHVLARTVRDSAAVLDQIAGYRPGDTYFAPVPPRPFAQEVGANPGRLRVGLLDHPAQADYRADPECSQAVQLAGRLLESLGHRVEIAHPASLGEPELQQPLPRRRRDRRRCGIDRVVAAPRPADLG